MKKTNQLSAIIGYLFLLLLVPLLFFSGHPQEEFWWFDESRHAMDGVFFHDFFSGLHFTQPISFLEEYIVRYPALSFTWNLPFFALVEAPFFWAFGVSTLTAQMVALGFAVVLGVALNKWAREFVGPYLSILAVTLFFLNDTVLLWMRSVMLEIPALTMMVLFGLSFRHYLERPSYGRSLLAGCIAFAMLMTKQIPLFVFIPFVVYAWYKEKPRMLVCKYAWPAYALILLGMIVIAAHALTLGASGFGGVSKFSAAPNLLEKMAFVRAPLVASAAYDVFGWPILILAAIGTAAGLLGKEKRMVLFLISWIAVGLIFIGFLTSLYVNTTRYMLYVAPPLYVLVLFPAKHLNKQTPLYYGFAGLICIAMLLQIAPKINQQMPSVRGYHELAKYVRSLPDNRPVLFCCKHDGNYIFSVRSLDPERRTITLRADKVLVTIINDPSRGVLSHVSGDEEIYEMLDTYGIKYLVIERNTLTEVPEFELLRKIVQDGRFEELKTFETTADQGTYKGWGPKHGVTVDVFRYLDAKPIRNNTISIPLPRFNRTAVLELD